MNSASTHKSLFCLRPCPKILGLIYVMEQDALNQNPGSLTLKENLSVRSNIRVCPKDKGQSDTVIPAKKSQVMRGSWTQKDSSVSELFQEFMNQCLEQICVNEQDSTEFSRVFMDSSFMDTYFILFTAETPREVYYLSFHWESGQCEEGQGCCIIRVQ